VTTRGRQGPYPASEDCQKDGNSDYGDEEQRQEALRDRQATHGRAGPRSSPIPTAAAAAGPPLPPVPLRFTCPGASGPPASSPDDITALAWLAFVRPPSQSPSCTPKEGRGISSGTGGGGGGGTAGAPGWLGRSASGRRRTTSSGAGGSVFASIQVMLEDHELQRQQQAAGTAAVPQHPHPGYSLVVLLSGTRGGALQLHHADSGAVLLRQQVHPGPVVSIAVRTWRMGLNPNEAAEDVTVGWVDAVVRLASWELRAAATTCYMAHTAAAARARRGDSAGSGARGGGSGQPMFGLWGASSSSAGPAGPEIKPLAVQKWEMSPGAARGRYSSVVCCGQRPRDLYSLLQGIGSSSPTATGKTIFLAGGRRSSCLAALEVDEQSSGGSGGALSYISSVATSVWGLARTARNVATAPLSLRDGLKSLVMNPLQLAGGSGAGAASAAAAAAAATPLASFPDANAGQRLPATGVWRQYHDEGRAVLSLSPAPYGSLVAAVDSLGRLLLVEVGAMLVSRMWKGYRDAQVAWLEVQAQAVARLLERQRTAQRSDVYEPPLPPSPQLQQQQSRCQPPPSPPQQRGQQDAVGAPGLGPSPDQGNGGDGGTSTGVSFQCDRSRRGTGGHGNTASSGGGAHGNGHERNRNHEDGEGRHHKRGLVSGRATRDRGQTRLNHGSDVVANNATGSVAAAAASAASEDMQQPLSSPPQPPPAGEDVRGCQGSEHVQGSGVDEGCSGGAGGAEYVLLLAVYAPRRQTLELWFPLHGERLAAVAAPPKARLMQRGGGGVGCGGELGTWRVADAASAAWPPMTPTGCMICFAGRAPRLRLGAELEPSSTESGFEGLELLDVGTLFGLT
ncbi:hypothetical protein VOLCADRAFT_94488, partial [Volvox carteri f. nagariensis]